MPAIRTLVATFALPSAAPHIFTGVETTLPLLARMSDAAGVETPRKRPPQRVSDTRTLALIVVLFLYVYAKTANVTVTPTEYETWRTTAVRTLLELPVAKDVAFDEVAGEAQELMPRAQEEGWLGMEWFENVVPADVDGDGDAMEGVEVVKSGVSRGGGSEYIGLGTMMQDGNDYLGEARREEFRVWKEGIMERVREIETR